MEHRTIIHIDMDAFFASVEQRDDPTLRGKPVLVGGRGKRGVVAAASYEARAFGCRSAMPTAEARRLCPEAIVVKPRGGRYREASDQVFAILNDYTPAVQPISIDEAFLDVTGSARLLGDGRAIARDIRARVRQETGLTASAGVAPNKFLAKLASDMDKPDGLTIIPRDRVAETIAPLPINRMWGVGTATEARLGSLGIRTFADAQRMTPAEIERDLVPRLGQYAHKLCRLARGIDDRAVQPDHSAKSISHERTFGENLTDADDVRAMILGQMEDVALRLRRHGRFARTVTVKIRFGDFTTITRSHTLDQATDRTDVLWQAAAGCFDSWARDRFQPVRLIGTGVSQLTESADACGLFPDEGDDRARRLDAATDAIAERYGRDAITRSLIELKDDRAEYSREMSEVSEKKS